MPERGLSPGQDREARQLTAAQVAAEQAQREAAVAAEQAQREAAVGAVEGRAASLETFRARASGFAGSPHNNSAHEVNYSQEGHQHDRAAITNFQHNNSAHDFNYSQEGHEHLRAAITNFQHNNSAHDVNYSQEGHTHLRAAITNFQHNNSAHDVNYSQEGHDHLRAAITNFEHGSGQHDSTVATNPHGNGQHTENYAPTPHGSGDHNSTVATNPHGNAQHTANYAPTPHGNGDHINPGYSEIGHAHGGSVSTSLRFMVMPRSARREALFAREAVSQALAAGDYDDRPELRALAKLVLAATHTIWDGLTETAAQREERLGGYEELPEGLDATLWEMYSTEVNFSTTKPMEEAPEYVRLRYDEDPAVSALPVPWRRARPRFVAEPHPDLVQTPRSS